MVPTQFEWTDLLASLPGTVVGGLIALAGASLAIKWQFKEQERVKDRNACAFFRLVAGEQARCIGRLLDAKKTQDVKNISISVNLAIRQLEENKSLFLENYSDLSRIKNEEIRSSLVDGFRISSEWVSVAGQCLETIDVANVGMIRSAEGSPNYMQAENSKKSSHENLENVFSNLNEIKEFFQRTANELQEG